MPEPRCELLRHYACVSSPRPGQGQVCPRCCVERELAEADPEGLKWHEVEVRAPKVRLKAQRLHPTDTFPEFDGRPKKNVNLAGMVSQMVMNSSASSQGIREVPAEFKRQMELREPKEAEEPKDEWKPLADRYWWNYYKNWQQNSTWVKFPTLMGMSSAQLGDIMENYGKYREYYDY